VSEGSFLNGFSRLLEKLAPAPVLDLALFAHRREVGAYASLAKLASEGSFLNGFLRLREKLAPTPELDLAFLAPTRELAPMEVLKTAL
jgi:hypothetical protein